MNEEIMTNENEVAAEVNENPIQETQSTEVATTDNEVKSLGKDLAEMAVVGVIIYAFCKLCDFIIDKVKAGVKKFKENRAAKKAQKQQAAATQQPPVANVQTEQKAPEQNQEQAQQ